MSDQVSIKAQATWTGQADPDSGFTFQVVAIVEDGAGKPVKGLKKGNFSVNTFPAKGALKIDSISEEQASRSVPAGTYLLKFTDRSSKEALYFGGQYVLLISVNTAMRRGRVTASNKAHTLITLVRLQRFSKPMKYPPSR